MKITLSCYFELGELPLYSYSTGKKVIYKVSNFAF